MLAALPQHPLGLVSPALPVSIAAAALSLTVAGLAWSVFAPSSQAFAPVLRHFPNANTIALTFDDGPTLPYTAQILDLLAARRIPATFFVIGRWVQDHPHLARRIVDEGHTLGNHSWDHHHFGIMQGLPYWQQQLQRTNEAIHAATGLTPQFFRPPMGFKTWHIAAAARAANLRIVGWSIRGMDTAQISPEKLAARINRQLHPGAIIALHDGLEPARLRKSQAATRAALPKILDAIEARNLRCVSLQPLPSTIPLVPAQ